MAEPLAVLRGTQLWAGLGYAEQQIWGQLCERCGVVQNGSVQGSDLTPKLQRLDDVK